MGRLIWRMTLVFTLGLLLLVPTLAPAEGEQPKTGAPPIEQPLVSEGSFAVSLAAALAVVTTDDEVEAESRLGEVGIAPRNGWIADYPVTPDILVELRDAVAAAADKDLLSMNREEAIQKLNDVTAGFGLSIRPHAVGTVYEPNPASCATYPNPAVISETYTREGAPVVTYYCPPPDYYDKYAWVPSPFWWSDLWFPGFFILLDFHKVVHVHRHVVVIRNHFNDFRTRQSFRIDPRDRFRGKTFAGIGVTRSRDFIPTGVPRSDRMIFNSPRPATAPEGRTLSPGSRGQERGGPSIRGQDRGGSIMRGPERSGGSGGSGGRGSSGRGSRR